MADIARIHVEARRSGTNRPILNAAGAPINEMIECSIDVPADALGEACAECMQRAWRTGIDGKDIKLVVTFS